MRLVPWRPGGWTVDDLHLLPHGDGCKYELIDGALWVEPPPPPEHADVIERLAGALAEAATGTELRVAPWRSSPQPELSELAPQVDDEVTWVGVEDPDRDGWRVEHLESVPQGVWLELVDGSIHLPPQPTQEHQAGVRALAARLSASMASVLVQPDVVLGGRIRLRPDVLVAGAAATPFLVLEVTEQTTRLVDRVLRPVLWSNSGLPHFWRLDLERLGLVTYQLDGDAYRETGCYADEVDLDHPVRLRLRLDELLH